MYQKIDIPEELRDRKERNYSIATLENWADIEKIFSQECNQWIFRGQQDCDWDIRPSLCRKDIIYGFESAEGIMSDLWKNTKDFAEIKKIKPKTEFDRVCIMQHYGVPTRLLDWTRCPYIAAFFAFLVEPRKSHCSVWAINRKWCEDTAVKRIKEKIPDRFMKFKIARSLRKKFYSEFNKRGINVAKLFQESLDYYGNLVLRQFEWVNQIREEQRQKVADDRKAE